MARRLIVDLLFSIRPFCHLLFLLSEINARFEIIKPVNILVSMILKAIG